MDYTSLAIKQQLNSVDTQSQDNIAKVEQYLHIPSGLTGFINTATEIRTAKSERQIFLLKGNLAQSMDERICPECQSPMHINLSTEQVLRHLPVGGSLMQVSFARTQFLCPRCKHTHMQSIPFKSAHHRITVELETYVCDLLAMGTFTLKEVAELAGLGQNTVKAIDKRRLLALHTEDGKLKKPDDHAVFLGIDEFKLHRRNKYATHIIDMTTGHILWIAEGKKKKVVFDFIKHVGLEWMKSVKAVAMDMNSDFQEAFKDTCPHIEIVFDHFHIVKNFNEMVVAEARKAEELRLKKEGREEDARALKRCGRILAMSRNTMESLDKKVASGKAIHKGSELFNSPEYQYKGGLTERYEAVIRDNDLLTTVDIVKCKLAESFRIGDLEEMDEYQQKGMDGNVDSHVSARERMRQAIQDIINQCNGTDKWYFKKFARLLGKHIDGIISHATYHISSGKIEGINNKIKTLRRQGYGYPDDEYFFLKLLDMSRSGSNRKVSSHRICD